MTPATTAPASNIIEKTIRGIELWEVEQTATALPGFDYIVAHYVEWDQRLGRWLNVLLVRVEQPAA
jgi:hypothetical protein